MNNVLIFSVAINGYQYLYQRNFVSHKRYADRFGFDCKCVTEPSLSSAGVECAWLKIPLILAAFKRGYDWVVFVDADTEITSVCPDIRAVEAIGKTIYMAKGYSERYNSGVIICRNHSDSVRFFEQVMSRKNQPLEECDKVGWGENGHIIRRAKVSECVLEVGSQWNNNRFPKMADYIRHYSFGPMRRFFKPTIKEYLLFYGYRKLASIMCRLRELKNRDQDTVLDDLVAQAKAKYPCFR